MEQKINKEKKKEEYDSVCSCCAESGKTFCSCSDVFKMKHPILKFIGAFSLMIIITWLLVYFSMKTENPDKTIFFTILAILSIMAIYRLFVKYNSIKEFFGTLNKDKIITIVFVTIIILGFVYGVIIEPMLRSIHCEEMAREEARENCRYGDVDCIIDNYEYFYNLCLEHS